MKLIFGILGALAAVTVLASTLAFGSLEPPRPVAKGPVEGQPLDAVVEGARVPVDIEQFEPEEGEVAKPPVEAVDGVFPVGFEILASFDFQPLEGADIPDRQAEIPASIQALNGEVVSIEGYLVPLEFSEVGFREVVLSRVPQGCCFGDWPTISEFIMVQLETPIQYLPYGTAVIEGEFLAKEEVDEHGFTQNIYRIKKAAIVGGAG